MDAAIQALLKQIPKVDAVLDHEVMRGWLEVHPREAVVEQIRAALEDMRREMLESKSPEGDPVKAVVVRVCSHFRKMSLRSLRPVVNATGIVVHTNLGRAPISADAMSGQFRAMNYSNLEFDLETGKRGSRYVHVEGLLRQLTGAEAAIVVNNNAAAVMLAVNSLADRSEVIISRGELVEIGGSFRIPDVITRSGGKLVEVGTTNKTHLSDYESAITEKTAAILKVHPSNFEIFGFTASVSRQELVGLARERNIMTIEDLGSGTFVDLARYGLPHEDTVKEVIAAGIDLVMFSGDKLLGGPQAGIMCGKRAVIERLKKNPLLRALRINKQSLGILEETLCIYRDRKNPEEKIPVLQLLSTPIEKLAQNAADLAETLNEIEGVRAETGDDHGYSGGGALPDKKIPTKVVFVQIKDLSPDAIAARMRYCGVVGRIRDDRYVLDVRTIFDHDVFQIVDAVRLSSQ